MIRNDRIMDNTSSKSFDEVIANAEYELVEALKNYSKAFIESSSESNGVPTINQIENMWLKLNDDTRKIFVELISGSISSVNESELISSKKENT